MARNRAAIRRSFSGSGTGRFSRELTLSGEVAPLFISPIPECRSTISRLREMVLCKYCLRVCGLNQPLPGAAAAYLRRRAAMRCCRPVLVTVRHESEGGLRPMSTVERLCIARTLLPLAAALDWEIAQLSAAQDLVAEAHAAGVPVIASAHDFEKTPALETLLEKEQTARALGADVAKFAFRLHSAEGMLTGVELLRRATGTTTAMGMGPLGAVSRLLFAQHGACLVYGYLGDTPTAPGQWSATLCCQSLDALGTLG